MPFLRALSGLLAVFVLAASLAAPADARTHARAAAPRAGGYDGNWSVLIVTQSGSCDRAYRYGVAIRGGRVVYEGSAGVNVDGRVSGNGAVSVRLWAGSSSASGVGRQIGR